MAEVENFEVQIDLWQLLTKFRLVLPTLTISQPKVVLEKNVSRLGKLGVSRGAHGASRSALNFPSSKNWSSRTGCISFDNQETNTQIELKLSEAEADGFFGDSRSSSERKAPIKSCHLP